MMRPPIQNTWQMKLKKISGSFSKLGTAHEYWRHGNALGDSKRNLIVSWTHAESKKRDCLILKHASTLSNKHSRGGNMNQHIESRADACRRIQLGLIAYRQQTEVAA